MKALLFEHPFYIQLLFFLNIGLHIQKWNWGFSIGEIIDSSLLNSPLLNWDGISDKKISRQNVINIISPLFSQNMNVECQNYLIRKVCHSHEMLLN
jgi:hypothetical protein